MRTETISASNITGSVSVPDALTWVFNPNYVAFSSMSGTTRVKVAIGTKSIEAAIVGGSAKVYISKIMSMQFSNPLTTRSISSTIYLYGWKNSSWVQLKSISVLMNWGILTMDDRFGRNATFIKNGNTYTLKRELKWFTNFPFHVSVMNANGSIYEMTPTTGQKKITLQGSATLVFEYPVFDYTFGNPSGVGVEIDLVHDTHKAGYYIRWIDNRGYINYFLFDRGIKSIKNTSSAVRVEDNAELTGMYFQNVLRPINVDSEKEYKGCAMNVTKTMMQYLHTICMSPWVDLYMGSLNGTEIWQPIVVTDGTYSWDPTEELADFEITFNKQTTKSQEL